MAEQTALDETCSTWSWTSWDAHGLQVFHLLVTDPIYPFKCCAHFASTPMWPLPLISTM
jgi:hypothetical protein